MHHNTRRKFIKQVAVGASGLAALPIVTPRDRSQSLLRQRPRHSSNDNIQIALIGAGGMGVADAHTAMQIPGVRIVAACDLYQGRLDDAKKMWGQDIFYNDGLSGSSRAR